MKVKRKSLWWGRGGKEEKKVLGEVEVVQEGKREKGKNNNNNKNTARIFFKQPVRNKRRKEHEDGTKRGRNPVSSVCIITCTVRRSVKWRCSLQRVISRFQNYNSTCNIHPPACVCVCVCGKVHEQGYSLLQNGHQIERHLYVHH